MFVSGLPEKQGLYDPANEHDNCGIGFVANIKNHKSHEIVRQGLTILENITHRGAAGADPLTGDGAGILIQLPHLFFQEECQTLGINLPKEDNYGVGIIFLPQEKSARSACERAVVDLVKKEGQNFLGWRDLPTDNTVLSKAVRDIEPVMRQAFIGRGKTCLDTDAFERKLFVIRKQAHKLVRERELAGEESFYIPTLSARTICFKGMMLAARVASYFKDLTDESFLCTGMTEAFFRHDGNVPVTKQSLMIFVRMSQKVGAIVLIFSVGMLAGPIALLLFMLMTIFKTSSEFVGDKNMEFSLGLFRYSSYV